MFKTAQGEGSCARGGKGSTGNETACRLSATLAACFRAPPVALACKCPRFHASTLVKKSSLQRPRMQTLPRETLVQIPNNSDTIFHAAPLWPSTNASNPSLSAMTTSTESPMQKPSPHIPNPSDRAGRPKTRGSRGRRGGRRRRNKSSKKEHRLVESAMPHLEQEHARVPRPPVDRELMASSLKSQLDVLVPYFASFSISVEGLSNTRPVDAIWLLRTMMSREFSADSPPSELREIIDKVHQQWVDWKGECCSTISTPADILDLFLRLMETKVAKDGSAMGSFFRQVYSILRRKRAPDAQKLISHEVGLRRECVLLENKWVAFYRLLESYPEDADHIELKIEDMQRKAAERMKAIQTGIDERAKQSELRRQENNVVHHLQSENEPAEVSESVKNDDQTTQKNVQGDGDFVAELRKDNGATTTAEGKIEEEKDASTHSGCHEDINEKCDIDGLTNFGDGTENNKKQNLEIAVSLEHTYDKKIVEENEKIIGVDDEADCITKRGEIGSRVCNKATEDQVSMKNKEESKLVLESQSSPKKEKELSGGSGSTEIRESAAVTTELEDVSSKVKCEQIKVGNPGDEGCVQVVGSGCG